MYSGSDSNESQKYPQWALNPTSYQNMPSDQVDWAALAQQWIIMKEAGPPPIPGEQTIINHKKVDERNVAGEAEMEVENEREVPPAPVWTPNEPPPPPGADPWNWNPQNQTWNWNNAWIPPNTIPPPPNLSSVKPPLLPTPNNTYNAPPESSSDNAVPFGGYNSTSNKEYNNSNYWSGSSSNHKHIKPHNKRYSKVNVPIRATAPLPPTLPEIETVSSTPPAPSLDAAKRKQLPAWIREGLEKMEKDKLKQMEKEKQNQEREEFMEKNKQTNKETIEILKSTMKERQRSRFDSDGENSEEETRFRNKQPSPDPVPLTTDELMLKVRRTMTEILLNVTSRHIEAICKEELQRFKRKYKASDLRSSAPSGANISSRLGLGMYGEDSESSSDDERDKQENYSHNSRDSDDELKDSIKRKMVDFQKTEREIEDKLDEAERRKAGSRSSSPESNDNDTQVDARIQVHKHHHDDKSPQETSKTKARSPSNSSEASEYSNIRSKNSHRSSSTDSKDSYKKSKSYHRSRSVSSEKRRTVTREIPLARKKSHPEDPGLGLTRAHDGPDLPLTKNQGGLDPGTGLRDQDPEVLREVGIQKDPLPVVDQKGKEGGGGGRGQRVAAGVRDLTDIEQTRDEKGVSYLPGLPSP
ncbi:hypothetical protein JTB14_008473 [Gonioctena quinquepunctata]|nr:hypothetical protein JTB14_008473 [Gonioctena quinquepunctata]